MDKSHLLLGSLQMIGVLVQTPAEQVPGLQLSPKVQSFGTEVHPPGKVQELMKQGLLAFGDGLVVGVALQPPAASVQM